MVIWIRVKLIHDTFAGNFLVDAENPAWSINAQHCGHLSGSPNNWAAGPLVENKLCDLEMGATKLNEAVNMIPRSRDVNGSWKERWPSCPSWV